MYPGTYAESRPESIAQIMAASGETTTYGRLDAESNQLARFLRERGLGPGDAVAVLLENHPRYLAVSWAIHRSGLLCVPVNRHLTADEIRFIVDDSDAKALVSSVALAAVAETAMAGTAVQFAVLVDGAAAGFEAWDEGVAAQPTARLDDERSGALMLYSSGTTGRPRGIVPSLPTGPPSEPIGFVHLLTGVFGFGEDTVYLSPAPLYHAAPLGWSMGVQRLGGTAVVMERFDAEAALAAIERYRVTHLQAVPTMLIRMLRLPAEVRDRYDLTSLRGVIHAAAPCPAAIKDELIEWLGPIVHEFYSASEGHGFTYIDTADWLTHRGSVGRPLWGVPHIVGPDGSDLPAGQTGTIWFEGGNPFRYHKDEAKTAESVDADGRATVGDIGYLDEEGFLYLTDREANLVIIGGVNVYPQEAEDVLAAHPAVADVAVFGIPEPERGEEIKAVVQAADPAAVGPELAEALLAHCREHLAAFKCPRSIDFTDALPRMPNGKLLKRQLRDRYWAGGGVVASQVAGG